MRKNEEIPVAPPGETIRQQLADQGMTTELFAERMGLSVHHVDRLLSGEAKLTGPIAHKLELVLGIDAQFWSGLEDIYREKLERTGH